MSEPPPEPAHDPHAATAALFEDLRHYTMPFGKYKGCPIHHLPLPYLLWFQHKGFPAGRLGELMQQVCTIRSEGAGFLFDAVNPPPPNAGRRSPPE